MFYLLVLLGGPSRPFTGAWIETGPESTDEHPTRVAPSRGRGLKQGKPDSRLKPQGSPLHGGVD